MNRPFRRTLLSVILLCALTLTTQAQRMLIPVGQVVGLSLEGGCLTVAAFDDALSAGARESGLQIGDEILAIDGIPVDSIAALQDALRRSDGRVEVLLRRSGREKTLTLAPAATAEGPKLGVYLKEGITGIGTVTYFDPDSGTFGALGHGVSDSRGALTPMRRGNVYLATVAGVRKGLPGQPGQLKGAVTGTEPLGVLTANTPCGVFGTGCSFSGEPLPLAREEEVTPGPAQILSNISGTEIALYEVQIHKVTPGDHTAGRDLLIQVTDPALLEATGGIVAGMSGSPILQNGKLVGAVTHVLVNDPTTGYGIFIENMLDAAA